MAIAHGLHLHRHTGARAKPREVKAENPPAGEPTILGGRVLNVAIAVALLAWIVALWQLFQLPVGGSGVTEMNTALWTALGIGAGISTFVLGIWKVHRA